MNGSTTSPSNERAPLLLLKNRVKIPLSRGGYLFLWGISSCPKVYYDSKRLALPRTGATSTKFLEIPMSVKVLICDDHQVIRTGLASLFAGSEIEIVGEAENGKEA